MLTRMYFPLASSTGGLVSSRLAGCGPLSTISIVISGESSGSLEVGFCGRRSVLISGTGGSGVTVGGSDVAVAVWLGFAICATDHGCLVSGVADCATN